MKVFKLLSFLMFFSCVALYGQNKIKYKYTYDNSGNRTRRDTIVVSLSKSAVEEPKILTEEIAKRIVKIYPNPTKGQLQVEIIPFEHHRKAVLTVYSLLGKKVFSTHLQQPMTTVDLSRHANGIYILHILIDKEVSTWKIIKE